MTTRTTKAAVTFTRPFSLSGFDGEQPAGPYSVETDEELLDGVSCPAYRQTETRMHREDASSGLYGAIQIAVIDPKQLEAALAVDAAHTPAYDAFVAWRALYVPNTLDPKR